MPDLYIVANWKCNPVNKKEAEELFTAVVSGVEDKVDDKIEVVIAPPFLYLPILISNSDRLAFGAQNCFWADRGAFTGEISPLMLRDMGVKYVILGHSERRKYFKENKGIVNKKIEMVLRAGLIPILCIDRIGQLKGVVKEGIIIAYEPLFAIGTGKACSLQKAKNMRKRIKYPTVLYGGSVCAENAKDYLEVGFQGLLLGGASLSAEEFISIIKRIKV